MQSTFWFWGEIWPGQDFVRFTLDKWYSKMMKLSKMCKTSLWWAFRRFIFNLIVVKLVNLLKRSTRHDYNEENSWPIRPGQCQMREDDIMKSIFSYFLHNWGWSHATITILMLLLWAEVHPCFLPYALQMPTSHYPFQCCGRIHQRAITTDQAFHQIIAILWQQ